MPVFSCKNRSIDLYYILEGKGPVLFLISGYLASHEGLIPLSKTLSDRFTTILIDNRGTGKSSLPEKAYYIEDMARDVLALMDHLNIKKADFVGVSMGSGIVLTLSMLAPGRINRAILLTPFYRLPKPALIAADMALLSMQEKAPFHKTYLNSIAWLYSDKFLSNTVLMEKKIHQLETLENPTHEQGAAGQHHALKNYDIENKLSQIKTPCLLLAGEQDILSPLYIAKKMHNLLPSSKLVVFQDSAHMIHHEEEALVTHEIKKFL
ncbi:hypothetical protein COB21_00910 [Candidatus Aerophobetes bacterium]|uniref:AB hydrolase-1 domain-containing protein n=1 Tax=Aerophobetes bacterium TaxID=2030807 RepID=A0A2A4X7E3_UNCAE|nr:MAG: hypothetical protein COB21_00910 [Candidatus Aerophobetes bacterium]